MIRFTACLLALVPLAACATTGSMDEPQPPARETSGECNADAASRFIGQRVTQALGDQILSATGARSLRWGPPGAAMTMDFRTDRVNVFYDEGMIVERITCG